MDEEEVYFCEDCERTIPLATAQGLPICCNKNMKKMPLSMCMKSGASAEHARFHDDDDACDEGRGG